MNLSAQSAKRRLKSLLQLPTIPSLFTTNLASRKSEDYNLIPAGNAGNCILYLLLLMRHKYPHDTIKRDTQAHEGSTKTRRAQLCS